MNTGGLSETVGALTLSASSTIDFGGGASVLTFGGVGSLNTGSSYVLTINNWSGNVATGGGTDALFVNSFLSQNELDQFSFTGYGSGVSQIQFGANQYEIVPIPEPTTLISALSLLVIVSAVA